MKRIAFILSVLSFQLTGFSQLGVGTNSPDASAQLDVAATDKGFLAPRIALTSATDVSTIATPATGLMIYNTATAGTSPNNVFPGYYYYNGTKWVRFINAQPSATISFSTADPNSGSPTFTPNTPQNNGYIYVSAINSSLWVWNGSTYISYEAPSTTPFYLTGSTTDAGGNKTSDVYRTGSIGVGTSNPSKLLDVVNTSSSYAGLIEAEGFVSNVYSRGMAIRMRRGTSASPTAIELNDISAYGFAGYDGTSFSTTSAGIAGIATQNWTSIAKGMGLIFSTTSNSTTTLTERMRIDHNGNVGIRTSTPATTLHMNSNLAATNTINVDGQMLRMMRPQTPYVKWENIAQFNLGSYGVATSPNTHAFTRLDLALNDGEGVATSTVMTWLANGNVGIGATSPIGRLIVNDNSYIANIPASTAHIMDNTTYRPLARLQVTSGANNNALSTYATTATFAMQAHNYSTGNSLNLSLQPIGGRVGIGSDQPIGQLANHATNYIGSIGTGVVGNNFSWSSALGGTMATLYNSGTQGNATTLLVGSAGTTTNTLIEASTGVNSSSVPTRNIFIIKGTGNIGIHKSAPTQQLHFGNSGNVTANKTYTGTADDGLIIQHYINTAGSSENVNTYARVADIVVASNVTGSAGTSVLRFLTSTNAEAGGTIGERMRIHGNGNLGIGTASPTSRLEVNGSATNNVAYNAGSGTSIDFSLSNLAYTTASAGTFTITNIKNGGTYSLAVQGATSGTSTFSCSGFTFIYVNNGITAPNKHTMYTFIVMGTTVYVYMATGF